MATTTSTTGRHIVKSESTTGFASRWNEIIEWAEFNRFAVIVVALLCYSCIGGVAAGLGAMQDVFQLSVLVVLTIMTQALILAVVKMKYLLPFIIGATLINTIILIANAI